MSRQVLLVDDDQGIRDLVTLALADEGYDVITAKHGAEAMDILRTTMPAVILLDARMPVMDGPAFASAYTELPEPRAPLVLLTASAEVDTVMEQVAAAAILNKPFDLDDLLGVVKRFTG